MLWQFAVGVSAKGKADRIVVPAEDALLAALKVKSQDSARHTFSRLRIA